MILRRLAGERFSEVLRAWEGATVVVIGGGLSLTLEQVALVRTAHAAGKVRCIAVNDAYLWAEFADVLYGADARWWGWQEAGLPKPILGMSGDQVRERYRAFAGQRCTIEHSGNDVDDAIHMLRNHRSEPYHVQGLSLEPTALATASGKNSGFQAINIATLSGGKTILLLGIDGRSGHFHGGHPQPTPAQFYDEMRKAFSAAENSLKAAGVQVVNCSPGSSVDSFPKMDLAQALDQAA